MKILVGANVPKDPNSGAAGTVFQTNQALRELGHEVDEIWADDLGRKIQHGNLHYLLELPGQFRKLVRERCESKNYDVIQLSQPHAYLAAMDHQKSKRKAIFVNRSHGLELRVQHVLPCWEKEYGVNQSRFPKSLISDLIQRKLEDHWRKVALYSDGIILPSKDDRDFIVSKLSIDQSKVRAIHHGVSDPFLREGKSHRTHAQMRKVLYVGQYCFIKGPDILTQVIDQVLGKYEEVTFTWVCSRQHHSRVLDAINKQHHNRLRLLDWMPQNELDQVYEEHGLFIFPSFFEGAGKAVLEAMAKGLCIVASDTGGMRDYIKSGKNGVLVDVGNVDEFVAAICKLNAIPELAVQMADVAIENSKAYTWQKCAEEAVEFYRYLTIRRLKTIQENY